MNKICLAKPANPFSHPTGELAKLRLDINTVFRDGLAHFFDLTSGVFSKKLFNPVVRLDNSTPLGS